MRDKKRNNKFIYKYNLTQLPILFQLPLLQPVEEPSASGIPCADIDFPFIPDIGSLNTVHKYREEFTSVNISQEEAVTLEKNTRDQADSDLWHIERRKRLTASNFGRIMLRKVAVNEKFVNSLLKDRKFTSAPTSYGKNNESVARNMYRKKTKNHVHECGLLINQAFPFIAATPDGKICENGQSGILEIKCPFSVRDKTIANQTGLPSNQWRKH